MRTICVRCLIQEETPKQHIANIINPKNTKELVIGCENTIKSFIDQGEKNNKKDKNDKKDKKEKKNKSIRVEKKIINDNNFYSDYNDEELEKEFEKYLK